MHVKSVGLEQARTESKTNLQVVTVLEPTVYKYIAGNNTGHKTNISNK